MATSQSSYLRQHADNPVNWWPWGPAAFEAARARDVPVLLSVGYAACHWCHVMAHESFEDPATAALINDRYVAIKVDREERPDVDAAYMTATQGLTGAGGWPMTCFLDTDGRPFYAGTYFPPGPRHGLPGFGRLLTAIAQSWRDDRAAVLAAAGNIATALAGDRSGAGPAAGPPDADVVDAAADTVLAAMDTERGGYRGAPKFPPAMAGEFLLRHHERTGSPAALVAVEAMLTGMRTGGIFDQLAGGFARYSVDGEWHVPHFEKMLDDNALLLGLYAHHARSTGSPESTRVATMTARFLLDELRLPDGTFAASLDADADGAEGSSYTWTPDQLRAAVGGDLARRLMPLLGMDRADTAGAADGLRGAVLRWCGGDADVDLLDQTRPALLAARSRRPQPARDELVVLRGNALAVTALADAGAALGQPDWVEAARTCLARLEQVHRLGDRWRRSSRDGVAGAGVATLVDYASVAQAFFAVHQAGGETRLDRGVRVLALAQELFADPDGVPGRYCDTARDAPALFLRPRDPADGAAPAGASALASALLTGSALTGDGELRFAAEQILGEVAPLLRQAPRSAVWYLATAEATLAGPLQIAVVGPDGADRASLLAVARAAAPGGSVLDAGEPDAPGRPLLADRPAPAGVPQVYICRGFVCDRPLTDPVAVRSALRA